MENNYKTMIAALSDQIERVRSEQLSAGTKYRLMGIAADLHEVTEGLREGVLVLVSREAVLDADVNIDYAVEAERVLTMELEERLDTTAEVHEQTAAVNAALGELSGVLSETDSQLNRRHKDEEYVRLYESEKRRYMSSGTARRARQTFAEWRDDECYGHPLLENVEDYRVEKLLSIFAKGVLATRVEHIQRAKRYPGEVTFEQLDDDNPLKPKVYRYYAALRQLVDFKDGCLVVDPVRTGRHFFNSRHEENAKVKRTAFLHYMHKVELVQGELLRLTAAEQERVNSTSAEAAPLNFFAPSKLLKVLLAEGWFSLLTTDEKRFDLVWREQFVEALMHSEWGELIARTWAVADKRLSLKCMIIGTLCDAGVLKGTYNQLSKQLDFDGENSATLAKYLGMGKRQPYAQWVLEYVGRSD